MLLLAAILFALTTRLMAFELVYANNPSVMIAPDTPRYETPGISLVNDGDMIDGLPIAQSQDIHEAPAYPIFIGAVYKVFGEDRVALIYVQIFVSLLSIFLLFCLVREVFDYRVATIAAMVFVLDPMQFFFSQIILSETLFVLTMIFAIWMAVRLLRYYDSPNRVRHALVLGLALGLATLVRPLAYYLVFCFMVGITFHHLASVRRVSGLLPTILAAIIGFAVLVAPWHVRNGQLTGSYVFTDNPSKILYYWKAGGMIAYRDNLPPKQVRQSLAASMPTSYETFAEKMALEKERGVEIIQNDIPTYLKFTADGVMRIMIGPGQAKIAKQFSTEPNAWQVANTPSTEPCTMVCQIESKIGYKLWFVLAMAYSLLYLGVIYSFAAIGLFRNPADKVNHHGAITITLLIGLVLYFVMASSGHSAADSRMRVPIMPLFALFSAYGIASLRVFSRRSSPKLELARNP